MKEEELKKICNIVMDGYNLMGGVSLSAVFKLNNKLEELRDKAKQEVFDDLFKRLKVEHINKGTRHCLTTRDIAELKKKHLDDNPEVENGNKI